MDKYSENHKISTCADLLDQNVKIHNLSIGMTIAAGFAILLFGLYGKDSLSLLLLLLVIIALGVAETFWSMRTGFDASLLRQLSREKTDPQANLSRLDQSLVELKLIPKGKSGRDLDNRLTACITLLKRQLMLFVLQIIAVCSFGVLQLGLL